MARAPRRARLRPGPGRPSAQAPRRKKTRPIRRRRIDFADRKFHRGKGFEALVRPCAESDFEAVLEIINDGAAAYRGVIPADRWKEPYMPAGELRHEIAAGVSFFGAERAGSLVGVMGIQPVKDVILIRHAYVRSTRQRHGVGSELLSHLLEKADRPVLIGTWRAARWAVRFYEKHGFRLVEGDEKDRLLRTYWDIPPRQVETSVVLADPRAIREIVKSAPGGTDGDDGLDIFRL